MIASDSRAIGMPGHDAARDDLVDQLTLMGLTPELQTTIATLRFEGADAFNAGTATNVIARLPGTASTGAVVLNAHYDGGSTGPAVVTTARPWRPRSKSCGRSRPGHRPPLANDLIVVFSDGEEEGGLGAAAFTQEHTWARRCGWRSTSRRRGAADRPSSTPPVMRTAG